MFVNKSIILKHFKSVIHNLFRYIGYDIVYYNKPRRQSTNINQLSYYETETGNYLLPTNAVNDIIANAIINNKIYFMTNNSYGFDFGLYTDRYLQ